MTSNSLTQNEEQDIPSHNFENHFGLHACYFLDPNVWALAHLYVGLIPSSSGQLAVVMVLIIPLE